MPSMEYTLGFVVGLAGALIIGLLLKKLFNKNGLYEKCEPDERQILARGTAYKVAFYAILIWNAFGYVLHSMEVLKEEWMGDFCFLGLLMGVMVYAIVCIIKDAYLGTAKNPGKVLLGLVLVGVLNLGLGISDYLLDSANHSLSQHMQSYGYNLICGIMLLTVAAVQGIKMWYNRCHEE